jgi:hypothetical protein
VERDGFEREISLSVSPRTQSETPVQVPAVNAAKLPMGGSSRATTSRGVDELGLAAHPSNSGEITIGNETFFSMSA